MEQIDKSLLIEYLEGMKTWLVKKLDYMKKHEPTHRNIPRFEGELECCERIIKYLIKHENIKR